MSTAMKRQKASSRTKGTPAKQHASSSINTFTRVSKGVGSDILKKGTAATPGKDKKLCAITPESRKRKAVAPTIEDDSSSDETPSKPTLPPSLGLKFTTAATTPAPAKRGRGRPPKKVRPAPAPLKRARSPSVSDSEESTINTDKLFKRLRIVSSPSRSSSPLTADTSIADSEADSDIELTPASALPREVLSLVDLHASFLKTLTIHYAHNGTNVPADLRDLCPNIARAWGKKKVTENDVRMCIGILNIKKNNNALSLSNYGRGKICVEVDHTRMSGALNEKELNNMFRNHVESLWSGFVTNGEKDVTNFISQLPKAPITMCESVAKTAPILAKGQRRLEDLKHGIAIKKMEKETKPAATAPSPMTNPDGTKMSLLDRIRFKQLQKASLPAGVSPAELERRSALQKVDEVSALIGMLSRADAGGQGRVSFTMAAMLEKLKDSFRMGISREEGAVCVRLLANEVAPEWVRVVTIGQREHVVIEPGYQLSKAEVERRVKAIIAKQ